MIGPYDQLLDLLSYQLWFEYGLSSNQISTNDVRNVVLLVVDPLSIHHYIFWSDQYYHIVHIMVEFQWYGKF